MIVAGLALALLSGLWPVGFAGMVAYLSRGVADVAAGRRRHCVPDRVAD